MGLRYLHGMIPAALILTSDFELCHMIRIAVERFGIDAGFALRESEALKHLEKNKFDLLIVDCSDLQHGCQALRKMRLHRTHRTAVCIAIVLDRAHTKIVCDAGANFVVPHTNYEIEIAATLRTAYGLILRERGRYNRFPLDAPLSLRCADYSGEARILNVSEGGMCIRGIARPLHGAVQLKFILEGEESPLPIQVNGNAVWQREGNAGIQFTGMSTASRAQLDNWLARQFDIQAKLPPKGAMAAMGNTYEEGAASEQSRIFGRSGEIRAIVTAIISGGPVRARCSACQSTITFGNAIGAALDQERKLREAFIAHLQEKHPEQVAESFPESSEISLSHK